MSERRFYWIIVVLIILLALLGSGCAFDGAPGHSRGPVYRERGIPVYTCTWAHGTLEERIRKGQCRYTGTMPR